MREGDQRELQASSVSLEQLQAYLQSKKWFEDGHIRNVATIWHQQGDDDAEIVLPSAFVKDFRQRISDAIFALAAFERREVGDVISEVKRLFSNIVTVRVIHADTKEGTIPINDGILLISRAKDLLAAAAQAVYAKRKHFTGPAPQDARCYLDSLLLGQTEIGSYVVNVIAPNQANLAIDVANSNNETAEALPLSQAITLNLVSGLQAIERARVVYDSSGDLKAFDEAVLSGVSANLCDALLGFSGEKRNRTFEITVTVACGPMFNVEAKKFGFDGQLVGVLERVSGYYKDDYILPNMTLTGYITKLVRPKEEIAGTITIDSILGDVERKVKVSLAGDDYHLAVIAHDQGQLVRIHGDVHIRPRVAELLSPKGFGVVVQEDLL